MKWGVRRKTAEQSDIYIFDEWILPLLSLGINNLKIAIIMAYHGYKFIHIGAVTIVNNGDHTLHYASEEEIKSRTFLINTAVGC